MRQGAFIVLLILLAYLFGWSLLASLSASSASLTLFGSSQEGWGFTGSTMTRPGPDLQVPVGDFVSMTLTAADQFFHYFWVDYDFDREYSVGEPRSAYFGSGYQPTITYDFPATNTEGVYTYYCYPHRDTMFGRFIVGSPTIRNDVSIESFEVSPTTVNQGETVLIIVGVRNEGDASETFNVKAAYNETLIDSQTVAGLWLRASRTLYYSLPTSNLTPGAYSINATAETVSGEIDTADNSKIGTLTVNPRMDWTPPTWPYGSDLTGTRIGPTSMTLSWNQASDNVAIAGYRVYQDGTVLATVASNVLAYNVTGLSPAKSYTFKVEAGDTADNWTTDGPSRTLTTTAQPSGEDPSSSRSWWQDYTPYILAGVGASATGTILAVRFSRRGKAKTVQVNSRSNRISLAYRTAWETL